jgi:Oxysterol-binding protein
MFGTLEYRPVIGANSAGGHGFGPMTVHFMKDGAKIEIWSPFTEIGGLMYGERTFNFYDSLHVKDA